MSELGIVAYANTFEGADPEGIVHLPISTIRRWAMDMGTNFTSTLRHGAQLERAERLLAIQNFVVGEAEGVDFLYAGEFGLTEYDIGYIRGLGATVKREPLEP